MSPIRLPQQQHLLWEKARSASRSRSLKARPLSLSTDSTSSPQGKKRFKFLRKTTCTHHSSSASEKVKKCTENKEQSGEPYPVATPFTRSLSVSCLTGRGNLTFRFFCFICSRCSFCGRAFRRSRKVPFSFSYHLRREFQRW